jgi:hypothetical protein
MPFPKQMVALSWLGLLKPGRLQRMHRQVLPNFFSLCFPCPGATFAYTAFRSLAGKRMIAGGRRFPFVPA